MGITRAYCDSAGRKHLFFNNSEAREISIEVRKEGMRIHKEKEEKLIKEGE